MHAEDILWAENLDSRQNVLKLRIMTPLPIGNDWKRKRERENWKSLRPVEALSTGFYVAWLQYHRLVFEIPINKSFPKRRGWDGYWGVCLKGFLTDNNGDGFFFFFSRSWIIRLWNYPWTLSRWHSLNRDVSGRMEVIRQPRVNCVMHS